MKKDGIKKNFVYQLLYQIIILVIPLLQAPYLTRMLGDTSLGIYTYSNSIGYYFVVLSMLGITRHGQRVIASAKNDFEIRKRFWSLFFDHVLISVLVTSIYFALIPLFFADDYIVYLINGMYVASAIFDITFLFYGLENFKSVIFKNLFVKLTQFILIILLVKSPNDLNVYTSIMAGGSLLGNVILIPSAIKMVKPIKFGLEDCKLHIKPLLVLSISAIASTLYTVFNKTLIGMFRPKEEVAYYEYAEKLINVPKSLIAAVGTVIFPRSCSLIIKNDFEGVRKYAKTAIFIVGFIAFASIFGFLSVGQLLVDVYYGPEFSETGGLLMSMTPLIFIVGLGEIVRNMYLIPMKKDTKYVLCVVLNSVINIVVTLILLQFIGSYGAVIGAICAEAFGLIFQYFLIKKELPFELLVKNLLPTFMIGLLMFAVVFSVSFFVPKDWLYLLLLIFIGAVIFISLTILYIILLDKELKNLLFATIGRLIQFFKSILRRK